MLLKPDLCTEEHELSPTERYAIQTTEKTTEENTNTEIFHIK